MQTTILVLSIVQLLALLVLLCCLRVIWARLPLTLEDEAAAWKAQAEAHRAKPPKLTPEERAQVAAYRAKRKDAATDAQSDLEVLALARLNPN
ncbi:hypothetical protein [Variovorax paradoxus]|uniref:Uncharacterized protein n=1 Tax=Variovorax paradoxus TaxID=34073 RepID=A0A679JIE5_VARPD|nr:hypothetical protein VVAX_03552 [Variovorax paradoxus]